MGVPLVRVVRSGMVESVHRGCAAVVDGDGRVVARAGDPSVVAYARSAMKPLQAAVSASLAGENLPDPEVAIMAASHNGEPVHVAAVLHVLRRAGLGPPDLQTPAARPRVPAQAGTVARPEIHNCSGKHAGMLLASVRRGFDPGTYREPDHPVQRAVLDAVERVAGPPHRVGVDGCGVPVHALPLAALAGLYARLATPERLGPLRGPGARVIAAMRAEPHLVGGRDRMCTAVMRAVPGVVVKVGAEGLACAALVDRGLGVAVKVDDGSMRAAEPALVHVLQLLDALDEEARAALRPFLRPPVWGRGRRVGDLMAEVPLVR